MRTSRVPALALLCVLSLAACDDGNTGGPVGEVPSGFVEPVWEYSHALGNSVTGGYVYRGSSVPGLDGKYVYADFGSGRIWALSYDGSNPAANQLLVDSDIQISSLGVSSSGNLFFAGYGVGESIYRLTGVWDIPSNTGTYSIAPAYGPFDRPVDIQNAGDDRLFVVEQAGRIRVFDPSVKPTVTKTFLDLGAAVTWGGELGLLGLAFHPDYATNGYFFVYYTTGTGPWTARLSRFQVSADPDAANPASEVELLSIPQEFANHNGGGLAFDGEGYLLVAVGDEGGAGDPNDNAQDTTDLHGSILRLDVDVTTGPPHYGIPADNPFAAGGGRPEIFAWGLRNPWRVSYDAPSNRIWAADVGQGDWEEINVIVAGGNYGWDCREGAHAYTGPPGGPAPACAEVR